MVELPFPNDLFVPFFFLANRSFFPIPFSAR